MSDGSALVPGLVIQGRSGVDAGTHTGSAARDPELSEARLDFPSWRLPCSDQRVQMRHAFGRISARLMTQPFRDHALVVINRVKATINRDHPYLRASLL